MNIGSGIKEFILQNFLFGDESVGIGIDDSFYERGIVDSTGVLSIVSYIEERYNLSVSDDEIVPENFDSIEKITVYIERKINGQGVK